MTENSAGIGTVTRAMVRERAVELALILDAAPESERWDPVHGSTGHKVPVASNEDEDDEGRTDSERLVEEGIAEAEHDQRLQAARTQRQEEE